VVARYYVKFFYVMHSFRNFFIGFDWQQVLSSFWILFAVLDILGSIPIIMSIRKRAGSIHIRKTMVAVVVIMLSFLFLGQSMLDIFSIDIASFVIAGSIILAILGLEMILNVNIFHVALDNDGTASVVPLAFPVVAGTGTLITLLALKKDYDTINILCATLANLVIVYVVIRYSEWIEHKLGKLGVNIIHKVMGIVVLSIAVKLLKTYLLS
jgi:multiple antibiotic resistance protein